jgi:TetR/AcrR family transcriptional repressor of nem operon
LKQRIDLMAPTISGATPVERRRAAIAAMSSMMGALILARMSDDPVFSEELLAANRETITQGTGTV